MRWHRAQQRLIKAGKLQRRRRDTRHLSGVLVVLGSILALLVKDVLPDGMRMFSLLWTADKPLSQETVDWRPTLSSESALVYELEEVLDLDAAFAAFVDIGLGTLSESGMGTVSSMST